MNLSREDVIKRLAAMPPHARGRRALEIIARELTTAEIEEAENERVGKLCLASMRTFALNVQRDSKAGRI